MRKPRHRISKYLVLPLFWASVFAVTTAHGTHLTTVKGPKQRAYFMVSKGEYKDLEKGDLVQLIYKKDRGEDIVFTGEYIHKTGWFQNSLVVAKIPKDINNLIPFVKQEFKIVKKQPK